MDPSMEPPPREIAMIDAFTGASGNGSSFIFLPIALFLVFDFYPIH